jgi:hypothetical protein
MNETGNGSLHNLNDCGCCAGVTALTPAPVKNHPGLSAIAYRVGTHSQFKQTMLAALSDPAWPALQDLRSRDDDDFSIALLDAWAAVADVLSFYQERFANEFYLRTAAERRSLLELARLIGYELSPGVAASAYLAFTLDSAPGSPAEVTIQPGTKVQSIPGPNEKPQTFETIEEIEARAEWNAMLPLTVEESPILRGAKTSENIREMYLKGTATQLQAGGAIIIVGDERKNPKTHLDKERWDARIVTGVTVNAEKDWTRVEWQDGLGKADVEPAAKNVRVYALRQRAALFGHNAPDPTLVSLPGGTAIGTWTGFELTDGPLELDSGYPKIVPDSWLTLAAPPNSTYPRGYVELYKALKVSFPSLAKFAISGNSTRIEPDVTDHLYDKTFYRRETIVYAQSEPLEIAEQPVRSLDGTPSQGLILDDGVLTPVEGSHITLDRLVAGLEKGHTLVVSGRLLRAKVADPGDSSLLQMQTADALYGKPLAGSESLRILELPSVDRAGKVTWHLQDSEGFAGLVTTAPDPIILTGAAKDDPVVSEVVVVEEASGDPTTVTLQTPPGGGPALKNKYDRSTVKICGNVALATHGETVSEVLGSGDAGQPYQQFTLRQPPLTWISAPTAAGNESTLKLHVNDVQWQEIPFLYGHGPRERVFVTRTDDDGTTTVEFGDGVTGARLPTGQENVQAAYRKGIGLDGLVKAGQLSLLMSRPLGVKSVTNPLDADGADEPESTENARVNAPLKVLTLDRIVSLRDYEDFARAFAGIAKALATWTWDGQKREVFVTVAGPNGAKIAPDSNLHANLLQAMRSAADPFVPLEVQSYRPATFRIAAKVKIDADRKPDKVMAAVEQALRNCFSFAARDFGQPVEFSGVIAVIQGVPGVVGVDLESVYRTGGAPAVNDPLLADGPGLDSSGQMLAAELLTIDPAPLDQLGVMR